MVCIFSWSWIRVGFKNCSSQCSRLGKSKYMVLLYARTNGKPSVRGNRKMSILRVLVYNEEKEAE